MAIPFASQLEEVGQLVAVNRAASHKAAPRRFSRQSPSFRALAYLPHMATLPQQPLPPSPLQPSPLQLSQPPRLLQQSQHPPPPPPGPAAQAFPEQYTPPTLAYLDLPVLLPLLRGSQTLLPTLADVLLPSMGLLDFKVPVSDMGLGKNALLMRHPTSMSFFTPTTNTTWSSDPSGIWSSGNGLVW